jgi:hypothetical protein
MQAVEGGVDEGVAAAGQALAPIVAGQFATLHMNLV